MSPCPADFLPQAAKESWDRLRVSCTQPFNKRLQFGLSFLRIRTMEEEAEGASVQHEDIAEENLVRGFKRFYSYICSVIAAITTGLNCYELRFTAHARKDDIRDGVAIQPSYPKHVFWANHRVCELNV